ncbi:hypothetical protein KAU37_01925 [Candidatus Bipolaricaulota bacterium]|nr:hypothetical protein [Candidatus Bipolaricaulota bacterium]
MPQGEREAPRECLHWVDGLLRSMEMSLQGDDPANVWKYGSFKQFARKYNQIVTEIAKRTALPPIIEMFDVEKMPSAYDTIALQQKEYFEAVYVNASVLRGVLESELGVIQDETESLRDFFQARLRSAILEKPTREHDVQDVVEQLLIGRGLQKGSDYDREVGRVKVSAKEVVPDFVLLGLGLAVELKLISRAERVKEAIDEINADIAAYSKAYRNLLFVVYDLGFIRDELEFRQDLERTDNVSVIVVKH